ncbi:unnamed protein product, partial [Rotaria magnacalcarata]
MYKHVGQLNFILHINAFNVQPLPNKGIPSWTNATELKPFHYETVTNIPYANPQNVGLANVEEGNINGKSFLIERKSIGRSCFNKDPSARLLRREYSIHKKDPNVLHVKVFMSTSRMNENEKPFEHLTIRYRKVSN